MSVPRSGFGPNARHDDPLMSLAKVRSARTTKLCVAQAGSVVCLRHFALRLLTV
jgi:hypothetical protein